MREGLVSIISPCYNVEKLLPRLLDSLLVQSYKKLEIILINDGSSDNTWRTINEYVPRLEAQGYLVKVLNQKNEGVASVMNGGLKLFSGEFLTWPDSDDWLTPDSIAERVRVFREYPEVGLVRCNAEMIDQQGVCSQRAFCGFVVYQNILCTRLLHGAFVDVSESKS
jgi:glycosyltransferase involved in cell wall biosynthesis